MGRLVPTQVGDVQVWVETLPAGPGTEPTAGRVEDAGRRVVAAFDQAQDAIVEIAGKVAGSVAAMAKRSVDPDKMQVEFGLSFTVKGDLVVVGSTAAASLKVTLTYERDRAVEPGEAGGTAAIPVAGSSPAPGSSPGSGS